MAEISEVSGISGSILELFREAGIATAEELICRRISEISTALEEANQAREDSLRQPTETTIRAWQDAARILLERRGGSTAKAVAEEHLQAAGIDLDALPAAKVVDSPPPDERETLPGGEPAAPTPSELSTERDKAEPAQIPAEPAAASAAGRPGSQEPVNPKPEGLARGNQKSEGPVESDGSPGRRSNAQAVEKAPPDPPEWSYELDPSTNRFRQLETVKRSKPPVHRRNRGMSHPDAPKVRLAAVITILTAASSLVAAIVLTAALVMALGYGWEFHWTIALLLLVFPIALLLYLAFGAKARCRLCGQRLFVPRNCLKHERAKRSVFGFTYAVARDAALFGRYRCMLCGTKTRLKR